MEWTFYHLSISIRELISVYVLLFTSLIISIINCKHFWASEDVLLIWVWFRTLRVVGYCHSIRLRLFFSLPHLTRWCLLCLWKAAKELLKEEKRWRYLSTQTLFLSLIRLFCSEKMISWTIIKQSHLPNQAFKYICHFRWMISSKSVVRSSGFFSNICYGGVGLLAADMAYFQAKRTNQHTHSLLAVERKSILPVWGVPLKWGRISL